MSRLKVVQIIGMIDDLHGETSVPDTKTLEELEEIQSDIAGKIEGLERQIKARKDCP